MCLIRGLLDRSPVSALTFCAANIFRYVSALIRNCMRGINVPSDLQEQLSNLFIRHGSERKLACRILQLLGRAECLDAILCGFALIPIF